MARGLKVWMIAALATIAGVLALADHGRTLETERVLRQVPGTAKALLRVEVDALSKSQSATALVAAFAAGNDLSEIQDTCGFDPMISLDEVVVWAGGPEGEPFQSVGLLLRGTKLDAESLAQCYRTLVEARGSEVVRLSTTAGTVLGSRDGQSVLAKVGEHEVVTGSGSTVSEFLAVLDGKRPSISGNEAFVQAWTQVEPGAVTGTFIPPPRWQEAIARIGTIGDGVSALSGVRAVGFTTRSDLPSAATLVFAFDNAGTAERNATLFEVWAERLPGELGPRWESAMRSARVHVEENKIHIVVDLATLPSKS